MPLGYLTNAFRLFHAAGWGADNAEDDCCSHASRDTERVASATDAERAGLCSRLRLLLAAGRDAEDAFDSHAFRGAECFASAVGAECAGPCSRLRLLRAAGLGACDTAWCSMNAPLWYSGRDAKISLKPAIYPKTTHLI